MAPAVSRTRRQIPRIPKARRVDVTRDEFNRAIEILNRRGSILREHATMIADLAHQQEIQFKRIAQMQAEIDEIKRLIQKLVVG